jgi:predicted permease
MNLPSLLTAFANNILPIMLISGAAFAVGKALQIDSRSVGRLSFYFFSPVLVFNLLISSPLPLKQILQAGALALLISLLSGLAAYLVGKLLRWETPLLISVMVTVMFANNGNYGIPLVSFAFGEAALAHASIYFVFSSLLTNSLGVLIASLGHLNFKNALLGVFKVPTIYAVLAAALLNFFHLSLPTPLARTVNLAAGAGVPMMIVLLGLELRNARWNNNLTAIAAAAGIRLLLSPLLGMGLVPALGMQGTAQQAGVLQAGMSSAVASINLAAEYRLNAPLVAAIVLVSTLLSPLTLTPLILLLGN